MMDKKKVDQIIVFSLLEANRQDEPWDRELGPIHLVKYVYLADLAYSETHEGLTYTGTPWKFHHFGPWAAEVQQRIDPAVKEAGGIKKTVSNPMIMNDFFRYSYADDYKYEELANSLPLEVIGTLKRDIRSFGNDTAELLHYVYRTRPMVCAAPGENLNFVPEEQIEQEPEIESESKEKLSVKRKKMKKEAIVALKKKVAMRRSKLQSQKKEWKEFTPPRYDDVYFEGVKWIESLADDPIKPEEGTLEISPDFWKSAFRTDDEIC